MSHDISMFLKILLRLKKLNVCGHTLKNLKKNFHPGLNIIDGVLVLSDVMSLVCSEQSATVTALLLAGDTDKFLRFTMLQAHNYPFLGPLAYCLLLLNQSILLDLSMIHFEFHEFVSPVVLWNLVAMVLARLLLDSF